MIITIVSLKSKVGTTTTAIHLAAYFQKTEGATALVDIGENQDASTWASHRSSPFRVIDESYAMKQGGKYECLVIDVSAYPERKDWQALALGCDLCVVPSQTDSKSLLTTLATVSILQRLGASFRVLLTMVPPGRKREPEARARERINAAKIPIFSPSIQNLNAFQQALQNGHLVDAVKNTESLVGWESYRQVGREIVNEVLRK